MENTKLDANDDEDDETMDETGNYEPVNELELKYEDEDESDMDDEYESSEDDDEGIPYF